MYIRLKSNCLFNNEFEISHSPKYEFHIAKSIRAKYGISDELFSITGNVVFANNIAVRLFVKGLNEKRSKEKQVKTGEVNAAGLLDEIYHYLFRIYELHVNPGVIKKALLSLNENLGEEKIRRLLFDFVSVFPPLEVYKGKSSIYDYLNSYTADRSNAEITIEEIILLSFANINPANKNILELFDKNYLTGREIFNDTIDHIEIFFKEEKKFGPDNQDFFSFLKTPIITHPNDIEAQLTFIREKWGILLYEKFINRLLSSVDLMKEDKSFGTFGGGGPAPAIAPKYKSKISDADFLTLGKSGFNYAQEAWKEYDEPENFTKDIDWMPKVVLLAKNSYVWLDQLSKKYGRTIKTLDQIPDEELEQLAQNGFNGLWLIGIWERSNASRKIKHIMGNIDAVASAYSLYDYQIAGDLGGENAYQNLNSRALHKGIRLASDMVPNHTGIFSKWVIEKPDYFIQAAHPPFPSYNFTGPDLSDDLSVSLRIEDGYWTRSDAAVVFQRIDNRTGETRYIYHGNDGTNMPWNDTAQLNMIKADVREAVIQKIFEVARKFSIIRFDAAMTLAKKHFARLWYPAPGMGGDIPSRNDYSMTQAQFDELFPVEFWREVVDRINNEMPETLLLAEAFWLMEGYFVRSLGMHRVYNSAFMHMMMKEENEKYRDLITNTLEFEPEILKRYVNFMSNPDEETAIKQFGTDDKYFGICILMVTLPGLPMFAHGQIEGFTEKYGMEYQRAYYHETPNKWLIERHQREIFPLIRKRYLFSEVTNFWLFDFIDGFGHVNENVFAFTNFEKGERVLVFYNNKYDFTSGNIYKSSPKLVNKISQTKTITQALQLNKSPKHYYLFREHISNLEYIRPGKEFDEGFHVELNGFKYLVYLDFREVYDEKGEWNKLCKKLSGAGVPSIAKAFAEMHLEQVHNSIEEFFDDEIKNGFINTFIAENKEGMNDDEDKISFIHKKFNKVLKTIFKFFRLETEIKPILDSFDDEIRAVAKLNEILKTFFEANKNSINFELHKTILTNCSSNYRENSVMYFLYMIVSKTTLLFETEGTINRNNYFEAALLDKPVKEILQRLGKGEYEVYRYVILVNILNKIFFSSDDIFNVSKIKNGMENKGNDDFNFTWVIKLLQNKEVQEFIGVNDFENVLFFSKENFEEFISWIFTINVLKYVSNDLIKKIKSPSQKHDLDISTLRKKITLAFNKYKKILSVSHNSEYKLGVFIENLERLF